MVERDYYNEGRSRIGSAYRMAITKAPEAEQNLDWEQFCQKYATFSFLQPEGYKPKINGKTRYGRRLTPWATFSPLEWIRRS